MFHPAQGPHRNVKDESDMNTEDARTKLSPDLHRRFSGIATAMGDEMAVILRVLITEFVEKKEREYTLAHRIFGTKGPAGDSRGIDE